MIATVVEKKEVQKMLAALREAGLKVNKINDGYEVKAYGPDKVEIVVFKAMNGRGNYLVRMVDNLFD
jgi:hypothetical protein